MNETTVTKLKDTELAEIKKLQTNMQETTMKLGILQIEKMELDTAVSSYVSREAELKEVWQKNILEERQLLDNILKSYGEGQLSLKDGTFVKDIKKQLI